MTDTLRFRTFPVELEEGEGRTLAGRLVPYNEPAMVADLGVPYEEMFGPAAFARDPRLRKAPNRVELRFEHREGILDTLGHGVSFDEQENGLHGVFRALDTAAGDQALALARAGILRCFSVGFEAKRSSRDGGVVVRLACRLGEVSLVREGAYKGTEVAVRHATFAGFEKPARNSDLDQRLAVLGFRQT